MPPVPPVTSCCESCCILLHPVTVGHVFVRFSQDFLPQQQIAICRRPPAQGGQDSCSSFSYCFHGVSAFPTAGHPLTPVPAALNVFKLKNSKAISELKKDPLGSRGGEGGPMHPLEPPRVPLPWDPGSNGPLVSLKGLGVPKPPNWTIPSNVL